MNNLIIGYNVKIKKNINKYIPNLFILYRWINVTLKYFFFNINITINISIVNSFKIKQLNFYFANNNNITDVLSFPYYYFYNKNHLILGDIYICHDILIKYSNKKNIHILKQYARVIIHSILHLVKFNHYNKFNANKMFKLEKSILYQLGY